jgi:hypothetical protein
MMKPVNVTNERVAYAPSEAAGSVIKVVAEGISREPEICPVCGGNRTLLREMMEDGDSACRHHKE